MGIMAAQCRSSSGRASSHWIGHHDRSGLRPIGVAMGTALNCTQTDRNPMPIARSSLQTMASVPGWDPGSARVPLRTTAAGAALCSRALQRRALARGDSAGRQEIVSQDRTGSRAIRAAASTPSKVGTAAHQVSEEAGVSAVAEATALGVAAAASVVAVVIRVAATPAVGTIANGESSSDRLRPGANPRTLTRACSNLRGQAKRGLELSGAREVIAECAMQNVAGA
jgi:hypothetical protein